MANERRCRERRSRRVWQSRYFWCGGRRRCPRRAGERDHGYTDVYGSGVMASVAVVMGGCVLDALLTLYLLDNGATEANPFMATVLTLGMGEFILIKVAATSIALLLLAIHHGFLLYRRLRVRHIMVGLAAGYVALLLYQLELVHLVS
ncbi:MAG TPA: DUF5658 family protein [Nitrococcus sp.]|nr:DUF5658 family protein [Nitrococcus sp.]